MEGGGQQNKRTGIASLTECGTKLMRLYIKPRHPALRIDGIYNDHTNGNKEEGHSSNTVESNIESVHLRRIGLAPRFNDGKDVTK
jgi:hypothetical protein